MEGGQERVLENAVRSIQQPKRHQEDPLELRSPGFQYNVKVYMHVIQHILASFTIVACKHMLPLCITPEGDASSCTNVLAAGPKQLSNLWRHTSVSGIESDQVKGNRFTDGAAMRRTEQLRKCEDKLSKIGDILQLG